FPYTALFRSGVDAGDPQRAELALALLAADVGVLLRLDDGLLGDAENLAAGIVVTAGEAQHLLVPATRGDTTLDSCHGCVSLQVGQHALDATRVLGTHVVGGPKPALTLGGLLGQDVALEGVAALELAGSGLPEALGRRPVGLHLGHCNGPWLTTLPGRAVAASPRFPSCSDPACFPGAPGSPSPGCPGCSLAVAGLFPLGREHHHHQAPFQPRALLDGDLVAQVFLDPPRHGQAQVLVGHLTAAEADRDLYLVAFLDEAAEVPQLHLVIALVRGGAELQFLELDLLLLLLGRIGLLLGLEPEPAVVHDPAHRRVGIG